MLEPEPHGIYRYVSVPGCEMTKVGGLQARHFTLTSSNQIKMQRLSRVASPRRARRVVCSGLDNDSQQRELWTRNKLQWQEYYQSLKNNFLIDTAEHKDLIQRAAGTSSLSFGFR